MINIMITFSYGRLPSNGNYVPLWSFCDGYESPLPVCKARLRCTTQNFYKQGWLTEVTWGHFDMMARLRRSRGTSFLLKQPRYCNACAVKDSRFQQTLHHFAYISGLCWDINLTSVQRLLGMFLSIGVKKLGASFHLRWGFIHSF